MNETSVLNADTFFSKVINALYSEKRISEIQAINLTKLNQADNPALLAIYDVYQSDEDIEDLIHSLLVLADISNIYDDDQIGISNLLYTAHMIYNVFEC